MDAAEDTRLDPSSSASSEVALNIINEYAPRFIKSIVQFGDAFFFISSLDTFWHYPPNIDDCANHETTSFLDIPQATIKTKKMSKKNILRAVNTFQPS